MGTVPTPATAVAGVAATAAQGNSWRDTGLWVITNRPLFIGRSSVLQTITTGTATPVNLDLEDVDKDAGHDLVTNNPRYVGKTPGYYVASAWSNFQTDGTGQRQLEIKVNGTTSLALQSTNSTAAIATHLSCGTEAFFLNGTTDYVEMQVFQNKGSNQNIAAGARLCVRWVETT